MDYHINSRDYLARAKSLLNDGTKASMFYAALELRCGLEARMNEYLEAQDHISKNMKKQWNITNIERNVESTFKLGEQAAIITITDVNKLVIKQIKYTPVRKQGREIAKKLGNYLHRASTFNPSNSGYWDEFHTLLSNGIKELEFATSGILLGPPLQDQKTGQAILKLEILNDAAENLNDRLKKSGQFGMLIRYKEIE